MGLMMLAAAAALAAGTPQVAVHEGRLAGTPVAGPTPVDGFFGVPFAQPPVGPLRWREPQPPSRWSGVREADRFAPRCMQQPLFADMKFRSPAPSEDCLYLNVWTPADLSHRPAATLPVLVYIYGGGYMAGDSSELRYDGASLARRGIVVVTLNYRLGVFGFLAHPELTAQSPHHASGNYGLLDQAAAIEWVRRNIARFGGDPKHITVGGESAGSMSVSALMASPLTREHFQGAIGESGGIMKPTFAPSSLAEAEQAGQRFAAGTGATTLAALRAMPADQLLAAQGADKQAHWGAIVDGWFLPETPDAIFSAGKEGHMPLLVGSNSQEGFWPSVIGQGAAPTLANYHGALGTLFPGDADRVFALYPAASDADVPQAATDLATDLFLAEATWRWFDLHRKTGAPTFYYHYTRIRPPALDMPQTGPAPLGAVHSAEIEYALGNIDTNPAYAWTDADRQVSATMEGYWANFIRTGDPNGAGLPAWPAAGSGETGIQRQQIDVDTHTAPFDDARARAMLEIPSQPR